MEENDYNVDYQDSMAVFDQTTDVNGVSATTANASDQVPEQHGYEPWAVALISVTCGIIVCGTVVGNILVCTAVAIVRRLRTPSNLLIVSLAVSDLLVAILVMPLATMYEATGKWNLGKAVCDMWTSLDVLLCTASILNLCAISVDRYFVITRPFQYAMKRTPFRMALMIICVWLLSALISIPPLFGWKAIPNANECSVSQEIGYQIYATIGAFYLPLGVMIVIYTRIYLVSSRIANAEARSKPVVANYNHCPSVSAAAGNHISTSGSATPLRKESCSAVMSATIDQISMPMINNCSVPHNHHNGRGGGGDNCSGHGRGYSLASSAGTGNELLQISEKCNDHQQQQQQQQQQHRFRLFGKSRLNKISSSNERKATKTLGVIMGAFTACWLPFFILAVIKPFCSDPEICNIPQWLNGIFLWLGYANSFLNPIIYARFNRDFRTPFKHILLCHIRDINTRLRSENYVEQFGRGGGGAVASGLPAAMDAVPPQVNRCAGGGTGRLSSAINCNELAVGNDGSNFAPRFQSQSGVQLTLHS